MHEIYMINKPDVVSEEMGNETVVINLESGCYYTLNKTASMIWNLISNGFSNRKIINQIIDNHKVAEKTAINDIEDFLKLMIDENLIVESNDVVKGDHNKGNLQVNGITPDYQRPIIKKHSDMQEILKLDPIHEVTDVGWPNKKV
jgi:hypothetical protein